MLLAASVLLADFLERYQFQRKALQFWRLCTFVD